MLNLNFDLTKKDIIDVCFDLTQKDVIDVCEELGLKFGDGISTHPIPIFYGSYKVASIYRNNPSSLACTAWLTYGGFDGIHTKDVFRRKMAETINDIKKYEIEERMEKMNKDFQ